MPITLASPQSNPRLARTVDIVVAAVALLLLLPVMLLIAFAILVGSGRPVLFVQERIGRNGVPFRLHKFRSLAVTADPVSVATSADARTTRVGRMLRRWRVDELPQLFDVLRGAMSLVGPRPEVPANLAEVRPADLARVQAVRPGMTGPTQLAFLAEDDVLAECEQAVAAYREVLVPAKVAHDLHWLGRRTLIGDLVILVRTPFALASRRAHAASRERVRGLLASRLSTAAVAAGGDG